MSVDDAWAGEWGGIVDVLDHTCRTLARVRLVGIVDVTCHIERDGCRLGGLEVEIGTIVETVVLEGLIVVL